MSTMTRGDSAYTMTIAPDVDDRLFTIETGGKYNDKDIEITVTGVAGAVPGELTANDTILNKTLDKNGILNETKDETQAYSDYEITIEATGGANVTKAGYLADGTAATDSSSQTWYITQAYTSSKSGIASATANAGIASVTTEPTATATVTPTGITNGISSSATDYYITATAEANAGKLTATGGSASASVTASSLSVSKGYLIEAENISTTKSETGTKTGNTVTTDTKTASDSDTVYLKKAILSGTSTVPSGYEENTSATVPSKGYLKIDAGYMPNTYISLDQILDGKSDTAGTGTADLRSGKIAYTVDGEKLTGTMQDVTPTYAGGGVALSDGSYSISNVIFSSNSDTGIPITITGTNTYTRAAVTYKDAVTGYLSKTAGASAYASATGTISTASETKYIHSLILPTDKNIDI